MGRALLPAAVEQPATTVMILINTGVWLYLMRNRLDYVDVGLNYNVFFKDKQYWRAITASFSHLNIIHLAFNMSSLWACGQAEQLMGIVWYLRQTYLLVVLSMALVLGAYHVMIHRHGMARYTEAYAVGYSCVVFGWMTILAQLNTTKFISLFGVSLPLSLAPFGSLIFTSLLVPQASFVGHLAGIVVGYAIAWGLLSWLSDWDVFCLFTWTLIGFIGNVKTTTRFPIPWLHVSHMDEAVYSTNIVGGQVLRTRVTRLAPDAEANAADADDESAALATRAADRV